MESVRLPDLETIRRFSIAVRSEHADVEDVIEALRADLQTLLQATGRIRSSNRPSEVPKTPARATPPRAAIQDSRDDEEEPAPAARAPRIARKPVRRVTQPASGARKLPPRKAVTKTKASKPTPSKKTTATRKRSKGR